MSIERYHGKAGTTYTPTCDICGDTLSGEETFDDAVEAKKDAGWKCQKADGEWEDVCPICQNGGDG